MNINALRKEYHIMKYGKPRGYIFMLHRVEYQDKEKLKVNENMKVSPIFLKNFLNHYREHYDFISIEEVPERLKEKGHKQPFFVFTLDDGYKDNYLNALPIFSQYEVPFTVFATSEYLDGNAALWWYELEDIILCQKKIKTSDGEEFICESRQEKEDAFMAIRAKVLKLNQKAIKYEFAKLLNVEIDYKQKCEEMMLSWDELRILSDNSLVTIGSHTKHHYNLKNLSSVKEIREEIERGKERLFEEIGKTSRVFAYPFGSTNEVDSNVIETVSEMDYDLACLAYGGYCSKRHQSNMYSLPRIMLTEDFHEELVL